MNLEPTDEQTGVLIRELSQIIENDRYPSAPHCDTEGDPGETPARDRTRAAAPLRHYEPPRGADIADDGR